MNTSNTSNKSKYYLIYYQNVNKEGEIIIKEKHDNKIDATNALLKIAKEYVKSDGGLRQLEKTIQTNSTPEKINKDPKLETGLYIIEKDGYIELYEKKSKDIGYIFTKLIYETKKIGLFGITELDLNNDNNNNDNNSNNDNNNDDDSDIECYYQIISESELVNNSREYFGDDESEENIDDDVDINSDEDYEICNNNNVYSNDINGTTETNNTNNIVKYSKIPPPPPTNFVDQLNYLIKNGGIKLKSVHERKCEKVKEVDKLKEFQQALIKRRIKILGY